MATIKVIVFKKLRNLNQKKRKYPKLNKKNSKSQNKFNKLNPKASKKMFPLTWKHKHSMALILLLKLKSINWWQWVFQEKSVLKLWELHSQILKEPLNIFSMVFLKNCPIFLISAKRFQLVD